MRAVHLNVLALLLMVCSTVRAQDLEPRSYSNAPVGMNFLLAGYGYSEGSLLFDPSVPIEDADANVDVAIFGLARAFGIAGQVAKIAIVMPYAALDATGVVNGEPHRRSVTGLADPTLAFSMNFFGAPALSASEFRAYRQQTIMGATLKISAPAGQYDEDRLINIGTNRWSLRPEIGISHAMGKWILEMAGAVGLYETNDEFFRGQRLEVDPIYSVQTHVVYDVRPGLWVALDATYYTGGASTIDGVQKDNELHNWRIGMTVAIPINRNHSIKLAGSSGVSTRTGSDFDAYLVAWQYRWGGGF